MNNRLDEQARIATLPANSKSLAERIFPVSDSYKPLDTSATPELARPLIVDADGLELRVVYPQPETQRIGVVADISSDGETMRIVYADSAPIDDWQELTSMLADTEQSAK